MNKTCCNRCKHNKASYKEVCISKSFTQCNIKNSPKRCTDCLPCAWFELEKVIEEELKK